MFCRNCGAKIPEGGNFCSSCGIPVKEEFIAGGNPQGKRPAMEGQGGGKKIDVSGEVRKNNPNMRAQSKGRKPLIIGVCSGILLLAVGTAILFVTGVIGGKDHTSSVVHQAAGRWGLSFQEDGKPPVVDVSAQELAQYNAYYMEETEEKVLVSDL